MNDCIFCKIVKGEIPCYKVWEDDNVLAFLDVAKDVDGHILVIPKKHYNSILDIDSKELTQFIESVQQVCKYLVDKCGYSAVNILNASGKEAGQTVFHLHFHIIPRKINDGIDAFPHFEGAKQELNVIYNNIIGGNL